MLAPVVAFVTLFAPAPPPAPSLPVLAPPVRLTAAGIPIETDHADPWVFDVDNDGKKDLLLGQFSKGRLRVYLNTGNGSAPRLKQFFYAQAGGAEASVRAS